MSRAIAWKGVLLMALAAALAAILFPSLRGAIGISRPNAQEFDQTRRLFADVLEGQDDRATILPAGELGFAVQRMEKAWQGVMLPEPPGACKGRGSYLFRQEEGAIPLAITAPHRGSDRHTGTIAASIFVESRAAAAAWNSAPRNARDDCPHAVDLVREPMHTFTAFALAFADVHPEGLLIQLHGFERMKRAPGNARDADIILSNGTRRPGALLLDLADCLSVTMAPFRTVVFPNETQELGALGNVQAKALREIGFDRFVHLELSAELRAALVEDEGLQDKLRSCLQKAAQ